MAKIKREQQEKWKADIHREWIEAITPYVSRKDGNFAAYIVGGAARGICLEKTDYSDIDIATTDPDMLHIVRIFFRNHFTPLYETDYSYTFELPVPAFPANRVQLLKVRMGQPEDVIRQFPLTVEQFAVAITPGDQPYSCWYGDRSIADARDGLVRINPDTEVHPDGILYRAFKYAGKGFRVGDDFYPDFFLRCAEFSFNLANIKDMLEHERTETRYAD